MKRKSIASLLILCFLTFTATLPIQDTRTFEGVYDGYNENGYNFIGLNTDGEEFTMTFHKVDESLLKSFDLKSKTLIGAKFEGTYKTKLEPKKDEDGYEEEVEIHTIIALKKL